MGFHCQVGWRTLELEVLVVTFRRVFVCESVQIQQILGCPLLEQILWNLETSAYHPNILVNVLRRR